LLVSVNTLTEADALRKSPQLMPINGGSHPKLTASVNILTEMVITCPPPLMIFQIKK
jgi:hypothetical protein